MIVKIICKSLLKTLNFVILNFTILIMKRLNPNLSPWRIPAIQVSSTGFPFRGNGLSLWRTPTSVMYYYSIAKKWGTLSRYGYNSPRKHCSCHQASNITIAHQGSVIEFIYLTIGERRLMKLIKLMKSPRVKAMIMWWACAEYSIQFGFFPLCCPLNKVYVYVWVTLEICLEAYNWLMIMITIPEFRNVTAFWWQTGSRVPAFANSPLLMRHSFNIRIYINL